MTTLHGDARLKKMICSTLGERIWNIVPGWNKLTSFASKWLINQASRAAGLIIFALLLYNIIPAGWSPKLLFISIVLFFIAWIILLCRRPYVFGNGEWQKASYSTQQSKRVMRALREYFICGAQGGVLSSLAPLSADGHPQVPKNPNSLPLYDTARKAYEEMKVHTAPGFEDTYLQFVRSFDAQGLRGINLHPGDPNTQGPCLARATGTINLFWGEGIEVRKDKQAEFKESIEELLDYTAWPTRATITFLFSTSFALLIIVILISVVKAAQAIF